ncbi:MAG: polymer-forming cytoskeletal protein [Paludibacteraceae bacterium]|nr:polymer-forming cytoskeletal protein [Paludibacteraceae bacterium]
MAQSQQQSGNPFNSLTAGSKIIGTIIADSDIRIDGTLEGDLQCNGKLVIGEHGTVKGTVVCQNAEVMGVLDGKATIENSFALRATGSMLGELKTRTLTIEPNAQFNGTCSMKQENIPTTAKK